eukprot:2396109-Pleurochrysis_carterae.AAC.3
MSGRTNSAASHVCGTRDACNAMILPWTAFLNVLRSSDGPGVVRDKSTQIGRCPKLILELAATCRCGSWNILIHQLQDRKYEISQKSLRVLPSAAATRNYG